MGRETVLPARPLTVVEGSYSQHPLLAARYDLRIFLTCDPEEQRRRLERREGGHFPAYQSRWIPMEERYFRRCGTERAAELVIRHHRPFSDCGAGPQDRRLKAGIDDPSLKKLPTKSRRLGAAPEGAAKRLFEKGVSFPMRHSRQIHTLVLAALFLALGMVLPFFTGQIPQIGGMLLPMHIPALLCGLLCVLAVRARRWASSCP